MIIFILHKNESKENLMFSSNILGEESLGSFTEQMEWISKQHDKHNLNH